MNTQTTFEKFTKSQTKHFYSDTQLESIQRSKKLKKHDRKGKRQLKRAFD